MNLSPSWVVFGIKFIRNKLGTMIHENIACLVVGIVIGWWLASDKNQGVFTLFTWGSDINMHQVSHRDKKPESKK